MDKIDIFIPSKDRSLQLHMLLESMGKHLRNVGTILVSWMANSEDFREGYRLLTRRVEEDESFNSLRRSAANILFVERKSYSEIYNAITLLKNTEDDCIMPLVDDEIFVRPFDLENEACIRYFLEHDDILCCALRLGANLTEQVSCTLGDGVIKNRKTGHATSLVSTGKPRYIVPKITSTLDPIPTENEFILYAVTENLNAVHWNLLISVTGCVYRKDYFMQVVERFGKHDYLNIEKAGQDMLLACVARERGVPYGVIKGLDVLLQGILHKMFGIYRQNMLVSLALRLSWIKRGHIAGLKELIVTPPESVCFNVDINSQNRGLRAGLLPSLNSLYIANRILRTEFFEKLRFRFPVEVLDVNIESLEGITTIYK